MLTIVEGEGSVEPKWEPAGGGGGAIILYPTEDVPAVAGLPEDIPTGAVWEVDSSSQATYVSNTPNGTALTYGELKNVLEAAKNGTAVITVYTPEEGAETFYPTTMYTSGVLIGEEEGFATISMANYNEVFASYDYKYTAK